MIKKEIIPPPPKKKNRILTNYCLSRIKGKFFIKYSDITRYCCEHHQRFSLFCHLEHALGIAAVNFAEVNFRLRAFPFRLFICFQFLIVIILEIKKSRSGVGSSGKIIIDYYRRLLGCLFYNDLSIMKLVINNNQKR